MLHLKSTRKRTPKKKKPKASRRKEITKIREETNEKEMETIAKFIAKLVMWEDKTDDPIKNKREKTQINKIKNEKGEVMTTQKYKGS